MSLSESTKKFIREYVASAPTDEEKKQRRRECAEEFEVSLPTIAAITAWTTIRENKVDITVGPHVNYDNSVKQQWRQHWKEFLLKNTYPEERAQMKVLCLPGKKCLEIPTYLEIGFRPENITGVEGDETAKREFLENAKNYGIQTKLDKLENLLERETQVYDVVSYDFTGPLCKNYLNIIKNTPIAPNANCQLNTKSFLLFNVMGKRETKESQCVIDFYSTLTRPEFLEIYKSKELPLENLRHIIERTNELTERAKSGELIYSERELIEKRDYSLIYMLNSLLGKDFRHGKSMWVGYVCDKLTPNEKNKFNFANIGSVLCCAILEYLKKYVHPKVLTALQIGVPQIIEIVTNYNSFIYDLEEYSYISPVNNANSPFLSEMVYFYTPMADYIKARYVLRFFLDAMIWMAKHSDQLRDMSITLRDKMGRQVRGGNIQQKDVIELADQDKMLICSLQWNKLMQALEDIVNIVKKDHQLTMLTNRNSRINLN